MQLWRASQLTELDQLERVHRTVGGPGAGRRWVTQQINDAYIVLLAAHFQRFCRDLHTEAVWHVVAAITPHTAREMVLTNLLRDRQLDRGNAQPASLGSDFDRLGMNLWTDLIAQNKLNRRRQIRLHQLNIWRNAIGHQDFALKPEERLKVSGTRRTLDCAKDWRSTCNSLVSELDRAVARRVQQAVGRRPW
jgi:hypothetical protein